MLTIALSTSAALPNCSMMSREVVIAISSFTNKLLCQLPGGVCTTKPRSICTGPPIITHSPLKRSGVSVPAASNTKSMVTGEGLLITMPSAPSSLCSQRYTTLPEKNGSSMLGIAIKKWSVRFIMFHHCKIPPVSGSISAYLFHSAMYAVFPFPTICGYLI